MTLPEGDAVRIGNRYRLGDPIGVGAMGAVWRATDELLGRVVAVKELLAVPPGTTGADIGESRERILREGRIGARLQHPHVISTFDVVVHEDRPWLVMEYLPSESLSAVLKARGPLSPGVVADIGRQVADGLAAAHRAGVVHRDVKPGNVLIAADGRVKLTDFGVSRAVDDVQLTRTGLIAGTPAFLPPEVAQGKEPTPASDVFALGATLYTAVEGVPPFGLDANAYALLHRVATGAPDPPRRAGPLTPVLMRLLAVDPAARPTAAQARDLLAGVVVPGQPVPAARPAVEVAGAGAAGDGPSDARSAAGTGLRPRRRGLRLRPAAAAVAAPGSAAGGPAAEVADTAIDGPGGAGSGGAGSGGAGSGDAGAGGAGSGRSGSAGVGGGGAGAGPRPGPGGAGPRGTRRGGGAAGAVGSGGVDAGGAARGGAGSGAAAPDSGAAGMVLPGSDGVGVVGPGAGVAGVVGPGAGAAGLGDARVAGPGSVGAGAGVPEREGEPGRGGAGVGAAASGGADAAGGAVPRGVEASGRGPVAADGGGAGRGDLEAGGAAANGGDEGAAADSGLVSPPTASRPAVAPRNPPGRTSGAIAALLGLFLLGGGATAVVLAVSEQGRADPPPAVVGPVSAAPGDASTGVVLPAGGATSDPRAAAPSAPTSAGTPVGLPSADPVSVVESYYALLPGDIDAAYAMLGPQAQRQSGSKRSYAGFWADIQAVTLEDTRQTGDSTVSTLVRFVKKDGTVTGEIYRFVVGTRSDGRPLLQSFSRL